MPVNIVPKQKLISFLIAFLALFLIWSGLAQVEQRFREQQVQALKTVLNATHTSIRDIWLKGLFLDVSSRASDPLFIQKVNDLLKAPIEKSALLNHPSQAFIRDYFVDYLKSHDAPGIFIITADGYSLASMRDSNIAKKNIIQQHYPDRLQKVFSDSIQLIPPVPSDVPLADSSGHMAEKPPTMFIAVPIKNSQGNVIAALSVRLNPYAEWTAIAHTGRIGETGETYLFNQLGYMLTPSRFDEQLIKTGQLEPTQSSILNQHLTLPSKQDTLTWAVQQTLSGKIENSLKAYKNYRGVPVLGTYLWDDTLGLGFITEIDETEAMKPYQQMRIIVLSILMGVLLLTAMFYYVINRTRIATLRQLAESRKHLFDILNSAVDSIITINEKGIIQRFNQAAEKLLGYEDHEVLGKNVSMLVPSPHKEQHDDYLANHLRTGKSKVIGIGADVEALHKDGHLIPVHLGLSKIKREGETIFVAILHDQTKEKEAANALRQSEQHLTRAQKLANIDSWEWDLVNQTIDWSDENFSIWGLKPSSEPMNHDMANNTVHPEDQQRVRKSIENALKMNTKHQLDYRIIMPDNSIRVMHAEGSVTLDESGRPILMNGITQDITERKKIEEELRFHQEELEKIVEDRTKELQQFKETLDQTLDSVFMFDTDSLRFIYVNEGAILQVGYNREELLALHAYNIKPNFSEESFREKIAPLIAGEKASINFETIHQHKDGHHIPVEIFLQYITAVDNSTRFVAVVREISERQALELNLIKSKVEADIANKAKSQFLATMSHELRTPMNGILGMQSLLLKTELTDKQQSQLSIAHESANILLKLLNNILDFSKIEAGKIELEELDFDLAEQLTHISQTLLAASKEKGIDLITDISKLGDPLVKGDAFRLRQIITNLVDNSIKFTKQGTITIQAALKPYDQEHLQLQCSITDTGIGIATEKADKLFHSFTQEDTSTSREYGGSGLGLAICKKLCQLMSGDIKIKYSEEGKGSCFEFNILLKRSSIALTEEISAQNDSDDKSAYQWPKNTRILLAEDNNINQAVIEDMLNVMGLTCDIAKNGCEAMSLLEQANTDTPYNLILMDCQMPDMDGYEASQKIRQGQAGDRYRLTPIVAITAYAMSNDKERCIASGMNDYIKKPLEGVQEFAKILQKWLPL